MVNNFWVLLAYSFHCRSPSERHGQVWRKHCGRSDRWSVLERPCRRHVRSARKWQGGDPILQWLCVLDWLCVFIGLLTLGSKCFGTRFSQIRRASSFFTHLTQENDSNRQNQLAMSVMGFSLCPSRLKIYRHLSAEYPTIPWFIHWTKPNYKGCVSTSSQWYEGTTIIRRIKSRDVTFSGMGRISSTNILHVFRATATSYCQWSLHVLYQFLSLCAGWKVQNYVLSIECLNFL